LCEWTFLEELIKNLEFLKSEISKQRKDCLSFSVIKITNNNRLILLNFDQVLISNLNITLEDYLKVFMETQKSIQLLTVCCIFLKYKMYST